MNKLFSSAMLVSLLAFGLVFTSCAGGSSKPSKAVLATQAAVSIEEVQGLENKLIWLQVNAKNGGNYIIEIDSDEKITGSVEPRYLLSRKDNSNITITLRGVGANRTISYAIGLANFLSGCPRSSMFVVGTGTTLVLDDNITLKTGTCGISLVSVYGGGTFVMNEGSAIIGGRNQMGGGVFVGNGTFLMKGGTISSNTSQRNYSIGGGASAGKYFVDLDKKLGGGGVWVESNGTFIKTGGTIANNSVEDIRKELLFKGDNSFGHMEIIIPDNERGPQLSVSPGVKTGGGKDFIENKGYLPVNGFGSQIYFDGENPKAIDNTVGSEMNFHFNNGIFNETQNEKLEAQPVLPDVPAETQIQDEP